uniref:Uncharacterized protein n=1 Tax=Arundo donax TaxID=35708 RepID=A0A0A9GTC2_ARUDO
MGHMSTNEQILPSFSVGQKFPMLLESFQCTNKKVCQ